MFVLFVFPWFASRGIIEFNAGLIAFIFASILSIIVYSFQMWQEGISTRSEQTDFSPTLPPAAAKPIPKDQEDKVDHE